MVRVQLRFDKNIVAQPITSNIILEIGTPINILAAHINQDGGEILADIESANAKKIIESFRKRGVIVEVRPLIEVDDDRCIECGACYSLCPVEAIKYKEDASIVFDNEKCLGLSCGLCVNACPTRAIRLIG